MVSPALGREAESRLLVRYHGHGDLAARDELVERFIPLARQLARRYRHTDESQEDLTQVACVGLLKAIDRYDPDRGPGFMRYAIPTMTGELKRHFRDRGWAVHVPRAMQERVLQVSHATNVLLGRLGRSPTPREVAEETGLDLEEVVEAQEAATAYDAMSLDAPRGTRDEDDGRSYAETVAVDEGGFELVELGDAIAPALRALPQRQRVILHLRFVQDMTQAEIAEQVGVSQMHVSRLLRRSLDKLGRAAASERRATAAAA
jgi:RNA polymerase sigma-B factor